MNNIVLLVAVSTSIICLNGMAQPDFKDASDKAELAALEKRVRSGDTAAMLEEADMKPEIVVPSLSITAQSKSTDPKREELARETLSRVKGVEDFLKKGIDEASKLNTAEAALQRSKQMGVLGLVRTNKAIRTIASYLFDDKTPGYMDVDFGVPSNKVCAAMALDDIQLPGAPSGSFSDYSKHVDEWRTWWLKHQEEFTDSSPYGGK